MTKTYLFLILAIFCEVGGTMLLPVSQNFYQNHSHDFSCSFLLNFILSFNVCS